MRKLLFGAVALLLMASCAGNGGSEKAGTDSSQTTDSPVQAVDAAQAKAEQARLDSIRQDSITKAEKAAKEEKAASQYDEIVDGYFNATTKLESMAKKAKSGKNINYETANSIITKCVKLEGQIKKVKSKLTPKQLEKYKKGQKKWNNSIGWFVA